MGKVEHDPVAVARPIDHPVTVVGRRAEGSSFPGDVAERHVGSAGLHQIEIPSAGIGWTNIGAELEICAALAAGFTPQRRKTEKGEVGGSGKNVEGKAQPYLAAERCHRCGQEKPGGEGDQRLPEGALKEAHGADCSCNSSLPGL